MKSIISQKTGMTELLILFPLFLGMLCVIAWVGFFLIQKTKMEKESWTIQTKKTYQQKIDIQKLNPTYIETSNQSLNRVWKLAQNMTSRLPIAFKTYLSVKSSSNSDLEFRGDAPDVIQHFYAAAFNNQQNITEYILKAEISASGSPMNNSALVKKGLWAEAMKNADFDYLNLRNLGNNELSKAGIPVGFIGEAVGYFEDLKETMK